MMSDENLCYRVNCCLEKYALTSPEDVSDELKEGVMLCLRYLVRLDNRLMEYERRSAQRVSRGDFG